MKYTVSEKLDVASADFYLVSIERKLYNGDDIIEDLVQLKKAGIELEVL